MRRRANQQQILDYRAREQNPAFSGKRSCCYVEFISALHVWRRNGLQVVLYDYDGQGRG